MKKTTKLAVLLTAAMLSFVACKQPEDKTTDSVPTKPSVDPAELTVEATKITLSDGDWVAEHFDVGEFTIGLSTKVLDKFTPAELEEINKKAVHQKDDKISVTLEGSTSIGGSIVYFTVSGEKITVTGIKYVETITVKNDFQKKIVSVYAEDTGTKLNWNGYTTTASMDAPAEAFDKMDENLTHTFEKVTSCKTNSDKTKFYTSEEHHGETFIMDLYKKE